MTRQARSPCSPTHWPPATPCRLGVHAAWPDLLGGRLLSHHLLGRPVPFATVNLAIGGNRLLRNGFNHPDFEPDAHHPIRATRRVDWDLLPLAGVRSVLVPDGTTDIFQQPHVTADELTTGLRALTDRLSRTGLTVVGATIPPRWPYPNYTPAMDRVRGEVNAWIRAGEVCAYEVCPAFDSGDHTHFAAHGHRAIARAIDLDVLLSNTRIQEKTHEHRLPAPAVRARSPQGSLSDAARPP